MKQSHRRGITLVELVIAMGIIGTFSFLLPILVKLFNNMAYLQQKSVMEAEVKAVMWQLSKEVQNATKVVFDLSPRFGNPNEGCFQPGSGNCMVVYNYDYAHYPMNETYEDPAMYQPLRELFFGIFLSNHVKIIYEVVQESPGFDFNQNGQIETKPYLLKRTIWEYPFAAMLSPAIDLGAPWRWETAIANGSAGSELRQTYFLGRIIKTNSPPTFASYGGQQLFKVTFSLKSSYDRKVEPPRYFSSILSMDSLPAW